MIHTSNALLLIVILACCNLPGCPRVQQPRVSKDPVLLEQFTEETTFPYTANESRKLHILSRYASLQENMDGDEVLAIMGQPDQTTRICFYGGKTEGWAWDYFLSREVPLAPSESDKYVSVRFDVDGRVKKIITKID